MICHHLAVDRLLYFNHDLWVLRHQAYEPLLFDNVAADLGAAVCLDLELGTYEKSICAKHSTSSEFVNEDWLLAIDLDFNIDYTRVYKN